jgi:hypothetical protein
MSITKIDQELKELVKTERKITHEILLLIQTLDVTKSFRELGYSSLFEYLTKEIGYSESAAQRRISSARLIKDVPKIEENLMSGSLNLSQVALVHTAIKQEEKSQGKNLSSGRKAEIVEKLKNKSYFETKKIIKEELPAFELPLAKINPALNNKLHVTLEFSEQDWKKVQKLLARMSHKIPSQKLEDLLLYWQKQIEVKENSSNAKMKNPGKSLPNRQCKVTPVEYSQKQKRKYIPVRISRKLLHMSGGQCEYVSPISGRRCESKHFLEKDHRIPLASNGTNDFSNFRILCRSHNQQSAKEWGISI